MIKQALVSDVIKMASKKLAADGFYYDSYDELEAGVKDQARRMGLNPEYIKIRRPTVADWLRALVNSDNAYAIPMDEYDKLTLPDDTKGGTIFVTPTSTFPLSVILRAAGQGLRADISDISKPNSSFGNVPTMYHELHHIKSDPDPYELAISNLFGVTPERYTEETKANINALKHTLMHNPVNLLKSDLWNSLWRSQGSYTNDLIKKYYKPVPIPKPANPDLAAKPAPVSKPAKPAEPVTVAKPSNSSQIQ